LARKYIKAFACELEEQDCRSNSKGRLGCCRSPRTSQGRCGSLEWNLKVKGGQLRRHASPARVLQRVWKRSRVVMGRGGEVQSLGYCRGTWAGGSVAGEEIGSLGRSKFGIWDELTPTPCEAAVRQVSRWGTGSGWK
jgi:hypothetical protein